MATRKPRRYDRLARNVLASVRLGSRYRLMDFMNRDPGEGVS